jgi:hypothetical protein
MSGIKKMLETPSGQVYYGDQQLTLKGALHHEEFGQIHIIMDKDLSENAIFSRDSSKKVLSMDEEQVDSVVTSVMQKYIERSLVGKKKYGTTLDRDDLTIVEWINHTQEELMDATLYLEKLKKTLDVLQNRQVAQNGDSQKIPSGIE